MGSGTNTEAVNLSARRVKTAILNGHGKLVNKNNPGDREAVSQSKEGPGPRPPEGQSQPEHLHNAREDPP